ncbi:MAG TPA: outer membrane protein assembly factor BamE [Methylotenera sp.]|nr:outer membrane protein assembly factor BamE [Methylotenera sp.]
MDIQQGNVVTSKMLLQLRPGMTKSQVKFIMGSPLIVDSFHKNRWDYFYQLRQAGKIVEQRRVILDFENELLTKVRGDVVPQGTAGAATGDESSVAKTITVPPKPKQEKSWADKLKFWKKDEPVKETEKPAITPEKADTPVANKQGPTGDAPTNSLDKAAEESSAEPSSDTPSMLAVPIGGVLAPDATTEAPAAETPVVSVPPAEAPATEAPMAPDPVKESPALETPPAEAVKPAEPAAVEAPTPAPEPEPEQIKVPMPASTTDERLIFRMDKNLDLNNLQAPVEEAPTPEAGTKAAPAAKPKKVEPPLPEEEAPGYFERMLEKIGF